MPRQQSKHAIRRAHLTPGYSPPPWTLADTAVVDYMRSSEYDPLDEYARPLVGVPEEPRWPVVGYTWRGEGDGLRLRDVGEGE
jgi:hypothetical protein